MIFGVPTKDDPFHPDNCGFRKPYGCLKYRLRFRADDFARCYIQFKDRIEERRLVFDDESRNEYGSPHLVPAGIVGINAGDGPKKPPVESQEEYKTRKEALAATGVDLATDRNPLSTAYEDAVQSGKSWAQKELDLKEEEEDRQQILRQQSNNKDLTSPYVPGNLTLSCLRDHPIQIQTTSCEIILSSDSVELTVVDDGWEISDKVVRDYLNAQDFSLISKVIVSGGRFYVAYIDGSSAQLGNERGDGGNVTPPGFKFNP